MAVFGFGSMLWLFDDLGSWWGGGGPWLVGLGAVFGLVGRWVVLVEVRITRFLVSVYMAVWNTGGAPPPLKVSASPLTLMHLVLVFWPSF